MNFIPSHAIDWLYPSGLWFRVFQKKDGNFWWFPQKIMQSLIKYWCTGHQPGTKTHSIHTTFETSAPLEKIINKQKEEEKSIGLQSRINWREQNPDHLFLLLHATNVVPLHLLTYLAVSPISAVRAVLLCTRYETRTFSSSTYFSVVL